MHFWIKNAAEKSTATTSHWAGVASAVKSLKVAKKRNYDSWNVIAQMDVKRY